MPITQSRMLSLLAAAQDYQSAFEAMTEQADQIRAMHLAGQFTDAKACQEYSKATLPLMLLRYPYESPAVVRLETLHFTKEKRRNERKAEKARENRLADNQGEPRPFRGNGKEYGHLGKNRIIQQRIGFLEVEPSMTATAPRSSPILARQFKPTVDATIGTEQHEPQLTPAQRLKAADANMELSMNMNFAEPEYTPGTLSEETKARVEKDAETAKASLEFLVAPGFTIAPALCRHPTARAGDQCGECGKPISS